MHNTQRAYWARLLIFVFAVLFLYSYDQMYGDHKQLAKQAKADTFAQVFDSSPIVVIGTVVGAEGKETAIVQVKQVVKGELRHDEKINEVNKVNEMNVTLTKHTKHILDKNGEYLFALASSAATTASETQGASSNERGTYYGIMDPFVFQWDDDGKMIRAVSSDTRVQKSIQPVEMSVESFVQLYSQ